MTKRSDDVALEGSVADPDPSVRARSTDLAPVPSIIKNNCKKNFDSCCFVASLKTFFLCLLKGHTQK